MNYLTKLLIYCSVLILSGCGVTTRDGFEKQFSVAQSVSSPIVIAKKQIPLPDGKWVVASRGTAATNTENTGMARVILVNMDRSSAEAVAVQITTNIEPAGFGWIPLKTCGRKDIIFPSPKTSMTAGDQECWFITHDNTYFSRSYKTSSAARTRNAALDFAHSKNLMLPTTTIITGLCAGIFRKSLVTPKN